MIRHKINVQVCLFKLYKIKIVLCSILLFEDLKEEIVTLDRSLDNNT